MGNGCVNGLVRIGCVLIRTVLWEYLEAFRM